MCPIIADGLHLAAFLAVLGGSIYFGLSNLTSSPDSTAEPLAFAVSSVLVEPGAPAEALATAADGGTFGILMPEGILDQPHTLTITPVTEILATLQGDVEIARAFQVDLVTLDGSVVEGAGFDDMVTIRAGYTQNDLIAAEGDAQWLRLLWLDESINRWEVLPTEVDSTARALTAEVDHFSMFRIGAPQTLAPSPAAVMAPTATAPARPTATTISVPTGTITVAPKVITPIEWPVSEGGNGHFYTLTYMPSNREVAAAEAVSMGGQLVSINYELKQQYIVETFLAQDNIGSTYWIGLTDQDSEGDFEWLSGEPVPYTSWNPGEPNNSFGREHYGVINWHLPHGRNDGVLGDWNDAPLEGIDGALNEPENYTGIVEMPPR